MKGGGRNSGEWGENISGKEGWVPVCPWDGGADLGRGSAGRRKASGMKGGRKGKKGWMGWMRKECGGVIPSEISH